MDGENKGLFVRRMNEVLVAVAWRVIGQWV